MNRRHFLSLLGGTGVFSILPAATTYVRRWVCNGAGIWVMEWRLKGPIRYANPTARLLFTDEPVLQNGHMGERRVLMPAPRSLSPRQSWILADLQTQYALGDSTKNQDTDACGYDSEGIMVPTFTIKKDLKPVTDLVEFRDGKFVTPLPKCVLPQAGPEGKWVAIRQAYLKLPSDYPELVRQGMVVPNKLIPRLFPEHV